MFFGSVVWKVTSHNWGDETIVISDRLLARGGTINPANRPPYLPPTPPVPGRTPLRPSHLPLVPTQGCISSTSPPSYLWSPPPPSFPLPNPPDPIPFLSPATSLFLPLPPLFFRVFCISDLSIKIFSCLFLRLSFFSVLPACSHPLSPFPPTPGLL